MRPPRTGSSGQSRAAPPTRARTIFWCIVVCAAVVLVLVLHAWRFLPFISDDALISLRYARRLLDGDGLTWSAGERVEGYSNLLWVLGAAALGGLGLDLIAAVRLLGLACSAAAVAAITYAHRPTSFSTAVPALVAGTALVASGPIAVWSIGGLEQPLTVGLLMWALVLCYPLLEEGARPTGAWLAQGVLLGLLCWNRPDGPLFTISIAAGLIAVRGPGRATLTDCARLAVIPAAACLAHLAFRLGYYGAWVPNSAYAKVALTWERLRSGLEYVASGALWLAPLLAAAAIAAFAARDDPTTRRRTRFLLVSLVIWIAYVIAIGGDIFPGRRHLAPLVAILALTLAQGLDGMRRAAPRRIAAWSAAVASIAVLIVVQYLDPENQRACDERWEWDGQVVGSFLETAFGDTQPLLAADAAGTMAYFSGLPMVDLLGINDRYLARHRPLDFGRGWLGHELGEGRYVLERRPDLVLFTTPAGGPDPLFRSAVEMAEDPSFLRDYRLVTFEGELPYVFRSRIWVRAEDGRLAIERRPDRVSIPGYLLMANPASVARLDGERKPAVIVHHGVPAGIGPVALGPGRWRLRVESTGAHATPGVRPVGIDHWLLEGDQGLSFDVSAERTNYEIVLATTGGESAYVSRVVIERP